VCSGGVINAAGQPPARVWLSLMEHAQRIDVKTAVVGAGVVPIPDARERIRVQRLLHHFAGSISVRNDSAKQALISYGLNANRVSNNGDPTLALPAPEMPADRPKDVVIGIVLSERVPSREGFTANKPARSSVELVSVSEQFISRVLESEHKPRLKLFVDDTDAAQKFAEEVTNNSKVSPDRIETIIASEPIANIQKEMSKCSVIVSFTLHGLMLSATVGIPMAGIVEEEGVTEFLASLGLKRFSIHLQDLATQGADMIGELLRQNDELRKLVNDKMKGVKRKEAQNARMLELLVPKRLRYRPSEAEQE